MLKVAEMKPWLRLLPLLLSVTMLLGVSAVHAQSVNIDDKGFRIRRLVDRSTDQEPDAVSRKDCLEDDPNEEPYDPETEEGARTYLEFAIEIRNYGSRDTIQIWASRNSDCTVQEERTQTGNCQLVYSSDRLAGFIHTAMVFPRVVIARQSVFNFKPEDTKLDTGGTEEYPNASICNNEIDNQFAFYIMLLDADQIRTSTVWKGTRIDTVAPPPPTDIQAQPGESNIFLEWEVPAEDEEPDADGFAFYCVPTGTEGDLTDGSGGAGSGGDGAGGDASGGDAAGGNGSGGDATGGDASGGDGAGGEGAGGEGTGGDLTTADGGAGGGDGMNEDCRQGVMAAGTLPSAEAEELYRCGSVRGLVTRKGQATGVENGVNYAVAVASRDTLNNRGRLSEIVCATPAEVTTFFERYKSAGGRGGGSLCGFSASQKLPLLGLFCCAGIALLLRRRRRCS